jgi:lipopolysaccharide export system protein LptA
MRWQRTARLAIAAFVIVFAAFVFLALRQNRQVPPPAESPRTDDEARAEAHGGVEHTITENGRIVFAIKAAHELVYPDGRVRLTGDPTLMLPERNGKTLTVRGTTIELTTPPDKPKELTNATVTGDVRLEASDGLVVTATEAHYDHRTAMVVVPGHVQFSRGRMSGTADGARYDQNKDVMTLLANASIDIAADDQGAGATTATASAAEIARAEHVTRLMGNARIVSAGRTTEASAITLYTTEDDKLVKKMELRGGSRISGGTGTGGGPQNLSAADIDVTYGPDGRAIQQILLMRNASLELPGAAGSAGRRIDGNRIDIAFAPDGATVTSLDARERVRVELPAQGDEPAKEIRSASLTASGKEAAGIEHARFEGNVEYRETRPARGNVAAIDRTTHAQRLLVDTAPGFGALQKADFRGHVRFVDAKTSGEAPRMVYQVAKDLLELSAPAGEQGAPPRVNDGQVDVRARVITFSPATRELEADGDVRSSLLPRKATDGSRLPSMLKENQPVLVSANRLEYDSEKATAMYTGNARLWQEQTSIDAGSILLEDKTGNLTARTSVRTVMFFDDTDPKTKVRKPARTTGTADTLVYEDEKRIATYTGTPKAQAHLVGPQGDVTGNRIQLTLADKENQLERAVAEGNVVVVEGRRRAKGDHLTYTAATETYVMTGKPVEVEERSPPNCGDTTGATLTFRRAVDNVEVVGIPGVVTTHFTPKPCGGPTPN